jgi:hypothetical protein
VVRRVDPGMGLPSVSVTANACPFTTSFETFIPSVIASIALVRGASGRKMFGSSLSTSDLIAESLLLRKVTVSRPDTIEVAESSRAVIL